MLMLSLWLVVLFAVRVAPLQTLDEFCNCSDGAAATCACDVRAYAAAIERDERARALAWEREKDEWRHEFQLEKDRLLADAAGAACASSGAADAAADGDDADAALRAKHAAELRVELELLQFPESDRCDTLPQIHFNYRQMGLGAEWHGLTLALTYAYVSRRTVVVDPQPLRWVWGDKAKCGVKTHECHFEPISGCAAKLDGPHADIDARQVDDEYKARYVEYDWWASAKNVYQSERLLYMKQSVWGRGNQFVPRKYAAHGLMWWRAQLLAFLLRPTEQTRAAIASARAELQLDNGEPYIGMHVRRGAKWTETPVVALEKYVAAARAHAQRAADLGLPVPRRIFVATDAADVVEALPRDYGSEFQWIFRTETYRHTDRNVTWMTEIQRRWKAASTDAVDAIRDVWLLAEAPYLVVTYSSNIGRVAAELRFAWRNRAPGADVTSVDKAFVVDP
jgi:glycoprotein 6-alpha-L-fucosyltransferase